MMARYAVSATIGKPADSSNDIFFGLRAMAFVEASTYSAYEPPCAMPMISSPIFHGPAPSPTASMTPAMSRPAICLLPGAARIAIFQSTGFTDTARTFTRTCPAPGSGIGIDSIFTTPSLMTPAFMVPAANAAALASETMMAEHSVPAVRFFICAPILRVSGSLRRRCLCRDAPHFHRGRLHEEQAQHSRDRHAPDLHEHDGDQTRLVGERASQRDDQEPSDDFADA